MLSRLAKILLMAFVVAGLMVFGVLAISAHAQQMPAPQQMPMQGGGAGYGHFGPGPARIPGVFGKVTAINGTDLTVISGRSSSTTYSVNATGATVIKNGTSSTLSAIAVNDMVMVQGTVSGDSVTAMRIIDGFGGMMRGGMGYGSSTRPSGTRPFNASGTFPGGPGGFHGYPSSTPSSTGQPGPPHPGFLGSIMSFFGGIFGHFKF